MKLRRTTKAIDPAMKVSYKGISPSPLETTSPNQSQERVMKKANDTLSPHSLPRSRSHDASLGHVPMRTADAKRSVQNIRQWNLYLPSDCVRTMVRMGWDYTT